MVSFIDVPIVDNKESTKEKAAFSAKAMVARKAIFHHYLINIVKKHHQVGCCKYVID
jgi:hypothetical protein